MTDYNEWKAPVMTDQHGRINEAERTDKIIEACINIVTHMKEIHGVCDQQIIWLLQSIEEVTSTNTYEGSRIVWSLLKKLAGFDETYIKEFHNADEC